MSGQTIGYARVSAKDQNPDLQLDALKAAGCDRVFVEKASGALRDRPELAACLDYCREGDVLVVWKLDRLGRSLPHLVDIMSALKKRGIAFRSLKESIDTTTATGRLFFHMMAALAEFERDIIRERADAGRAAAKARGETGGRPSVMTERKLAAAQLLIEGGASVRQAAETIGVGKSTLQDHLAVARNCDAACLGAGIADADTEGVGGTTVEDREWRTGVDERPGGPLEVRLTKQPHVQCGPQDGRRAFFAVRETVCADPVTLRRSRCRRNDGGRTARPRRGPSRPASRSPRPASVTCPRRR